MHRVSISVLIPTMNRPEALRKTLQSYFSGSMIPSQIVVVDQSVDPMIAQEIKNLVQGYSLQTTMIYVHQEIASLTKARNNAFRFATEEIIVCSDDDVDVYANTVENVFNLMSDKKIAMIAGIDDNSKPSHSKVGYFLGTKSFRHRKIGHVTLSVLGRYPNAVKGQVETQWAMGYFFVVRKSLAEKWQMVWDEKLKSYAYAEDLDYSFGYFKKAKSEGLRCILDERVRVKHRVSQEYRVPSRKSTYMYVCHRIYLSYKHKMNWRSRWAIRWCDFWRLCDRRRKKENPQDLKEAKSFAYKNLKKIKNGDFDF